MRRGMWSGVGKLGRQRLRDTAKDIGVDAGLSNSFHPCQAELTTPEGRVIGARPSGGFPVASAGSLSLACPGKPCCKGTPTKMPRERFADCSAIMFVTYGLVF
jgi:hypothetical protein